MIRGSEPSNYLVGCGPVKARWTARLRALALAMIAGVLLPTSALAEESKPDATAAAEEVEREQAAGPNPAVMAFDVVVLRPLGLVVMAVGAGAFVPAAILSAPGGREPVETALQHFVIEPYNAVFVRPLGRF